MTLAVKALDSNSTIADSTQLYPVPYKDRNSEVKGIIHGSVQTIEANHAHPAPADASALGPWNGSEHHDAREHLARASRSSWDVVVAGGGNAALVTAITAAESGRRVLLLEAAPRHLRAGNTRHTRDIRYAHDRPDGHASGIYPADELLNDLDKAAGAPAQPHLARMAVERSSDAVEWMARQGVRWQAPLRGSLALSRTNRFFLGGGTALANHYFARAQAIGVTVLYDTKVVDVTVDDEGFRSIVAVAGGDRLHVNAHAAVMAAGGFEANLGWLQRYWGAAATNYVVRGTPHNDGTVLARLLELGASSCDEQRGFHAVAVDARSPRYDGGIATRVDCVPFGIVVNCHAQRFADEGADLWPKRYASWGKLIAQQPHQIAYAIVDSAAMGRFIPPLYPPIRAESIGELATALGLEPPALQQTVEIFNARCSGSSRLDLSTLDAVGTDGLNPPKSNWARRLEQPPFFAMPLRPGITFTFMGVRVDDRARILDRDLRPFRGLFAAGEIMSGNILTDGYLAGFGLTIGTVFGRIAGHEASNHG